MTFDVMFMSGSRLITDHNTLPVPAGSLSTKPRHLLNCTEYQLQLNTSTILQAE